MGGEWIPHIPVTPVNSLVYASQFSSDGTRAWLLVNRDKENDELVQLQLDCDWTGN